MGIEATLVPEFLSLLEQLFYRILFISYPSQQLVLKEHPLFRLFQISRPIMLTVPDLGPHGTSEGKAECCPSLFFFFFAVALLFMVSKA